MSIKYTLNLDIYPIYSIIDWHKQGILTLEEIIDSKCHHREFGTTLKDYIAECTSIRNASKVYAEELKRSSETRMITPADRKIRFAS